MWHGVLMYCSGHAYCTLYCHGNYHFILLGGTIIRSDDGHNEIISTECVGGFCIRIFLLRRKKKPNSAFELQGHWKSSSGHSMRGPLPDLQGPQQQEQPPADVPRRSKKKQVSLPGASILFQRPTIPFHLIEPHSRRALNAPVELPDNPQGMINPNHPNHYLWVEMCNQLHTPITGVSGLQE
jgi:hypothetical protein